MKPVVAAILIILVNVAVAFGAEVTFAGTLQSGEELWMKAESYNPDTREYTLKCWVPDGTQPKGELYWTVRPDTPALEAEFHTTSQQLTYTFNKDVLYHIGCQAFHQNGSLLRGDFHIDRRTGPNVAYPNVRADTIDGLTGTFTCTPPTNNPDYKVKKWTFLSIKGQFEVLSTESTITQTVPMGLIWDIDCTMENTVTGQNIQWGLPVEFFSEGPAFLGDKSGCHPIHGCPVTTSSSAQPPQTPTWIEPSVGNENIDVVDFHIHLDPMVDANGDTHVASDFEMWDVAANERVWSSLYNTQILNHIHNADGTFEGNLAGENKLKYSTEYKLRARYYDSTGAISEWSEWRQFKTKPQQEQQPTDVAWTVKQGYAVELVASGITMPVNVAVAPDLYGNLPESERPLLYVTQLYGQIGMITKSGQYVQYANNLLNYEPFSSLPGSGENGVVGLYVDPNTGDLYVSVTYEKDGKLWGKVEKFVTNENGNGYTARRTLIENIPTSVAHQPQQITRGPDGKLYLNTGDADQQTSTGDPNFLGGKILRFNDDGSMPSDNPWGNYVWAAGFRNHFGADWRGDKLFVSHNGPDHNDGVYAVQRGEIKGWANGDTVSGTWFLWPKTTAPTALAVGKGATGFSNNIFVALSGATYSPGRHETGKRIVEITMNDDGTAGTAQDLVRYTGAGYSAPIGLAFGDDELYFTDLYGEAGFTGYGETQGAIYRIVRGSTNATTGGSQTGFSAAVAPGRGFPQGRTVVWECKAFGGSGNYKYDFEFGDGNSQWNSDSNNVYYQYTADGSYTVTCRAHDQVKNTVASATTTIRFGASSTGTQPTTPTVTITNPTSDVTTQSTSATITFVATHPTDSTLDYTVYVDDSVAAQGVTQKDTPTNVQLTFGVGTHQVFVHATDDALNSANSLPVLFTVQAAQNNQSEQNNTPPVNQTTTIPPGNESSNGTNNTNTTTDTIEQPATSSGGSSRRGGGGGGGGAAFRPKTVAAANNTTVVPPAPDTRVNSRPQEELQAVDVPLPVAAQDALGSEQGGTQVEEPVVAPVAESKIPVWAVGSIGLLLAAIASIGVLLWKKGL
jgi:aldose sugar dehydrogenase